MALVGLIGSRHAARWGAALLIWSSLLAREPQVICGTGREDWKEELFLHRQSMAARRTLTLARAASGPAGKDLGEIAVMYDSGGVVARRNPFSLAGKGITFTPDSAASRYRYRTSDAVYDEDAATRGALLSGFQDDDTRRVGIPFRFPFFGASYADMFINSNGSITFTEGEPYPVYYSAGALAGGAPRIAPLFADLDPSRSQKGVRVLAEAGRVVVTWVEVPEYRSSGIGPLQTFQIRFFSDGRIEFAFAAISVREAVTGISPGRSTGATEIVSFSQQSNTEYPATVAERFSASDSLDTVLLAQRFYQTHEDAYDYVAVYNTLGVAARSFAVATTLPVRTTWRAGFGDTPVDIAAEFGSPVRLQAVLNMGPLSNYPRDPYAPVPLRFITGDTPLTILAHEAGHLFLALASIRDQNDPRARPMLGEALAHWSFNFNSEASFLEGNRIEDKGENTSPRFETTGTVEQYSPLDQYLMGFRAPEEVPLTFLVRNSGRANEAAPQKGVRFNGNRQNIVVEEVIAAEGRRSPDHTLAQRRFRMAILLVVPEGAEPAAEDLLQIDMLRREFEGFYQKAAGSRAIMETALRKDVHLSLWPAAGVVQGSMFNATISLDQPAAANLTILLKTQNGVASLPASVTIPAGARQAAFAIRGTRPGVEEITAEPSDTRYRNDFARLQVTGALANLSLSVVAGDKQVANPGVPLPEQIQVRASDINLIPYPGVSVRASVTAPGTVEPLIAVTGPDGVARFRWTPGNAAVHELRATIEGASVTVKASALGRPAFQTGGVLNAASYAPGLAPGSLVFIYGANFTDGRTEEAKSLPWPEQLAGVKVAINGVAAPLNFVTDGQISLLVPRELPGESAEIVVTSELGSSTPVRAPLFQVMPGLFFDAVTGEAKALVAGTGQLTSQRPAARGEYLEIYTTGLGPVEPSAIPDLFETVNKPAVVVGGVAAEVSFSGLSPVTPGLYQINARVPEGAPPGKVKLRIDIAGRSSNEADVSLR